MARKMSFAREIKIQKLQTKNKMVGQTFSTLAHMERRKTPWHGRGWFTEEELQTGVIDPTEQQRRDNYIATYNAETQRLLSLYPNLKLID